MKIKYSIRLLSFIVMFSCNNTSNDPSFIKKTSGRYLYNSDEIVEVYFKESNLFMIWRGAKNIKPLKINDTTFYVKEMNEKIQFLTNPIDQKEYIVLVPKEKNKEISFNYKKLEVGEKIPSEYLNNNEYDMALKGYLAIKENDSLDASINEKNLNSSGYKALRDKNYKKAINTFKINIALYPESSNVYDSLGDAFRKKGDTAQAIVNYKKSLEYDSGNARAKRIIDELKKKNY